ncbi:MAG: hypothetical protein ACRDI2_08940, partial [Chloroflexota bacterium]
MADAADTAGREFGNAGRMLHGLAEALAYRWGQLIGRYSRWAVRPDRIQTAGVERLPPGPIIWANWHECNLLGGAINFHLYGADRCHTLVPPGLTGATMRGWVGETGFEPVALPPDGSGNPTAALKQLSRALSGGRRVVIAVD